MSWDVPNSRVAFDAYYSMPDTADPPTGWNHYEFPIDARSPTIPAGWTLIRGDGNLGSDGDWATFTNQIDQVSFGYWKPGYGFPGAGVWKLGIDNVEIDSAW